MSLPRLFIAALLLVACSKAEAPWSMAQPDPATLRTTKEGQVVGGDNRAGGYAWLGIPFAAPPVGELRWRAPQPPAPYQEKRQALKSAAPCTQFASPLAGVPGKPGEPAGSEDCLYVNIYAPKLAVSQPAQGHNRLPVMFWIHGGGNSMGTSSFYDGSWLANTGNVIVVSTQYRLGPFGWFRHKSLRAGSTDPAEQSGNFGTLDLIRSLEWVRDNIAAFGGDPGNVTIFGESAGGTDVFSLLLSPQAKGLFHRAIVESGALKSTTADEAEHFADDPSPGQQNSSNEVLLRLLKSDSVADPKAHLASMSDAEVASYLRSKSPAQLLSAYTGVNRAFGMIDMPLVIQDGTVLPSGDMMERFANPQGWNRVPVMLGSNHDEFRLFLAFDPHFVHRLFGIFPRFVDEESYLAWSEHLSRSWKAMNVDHPAAAMRRSGATDVYAYRFDWHGEPTKGGSDLSKLLGAAHTFEIPFVFGHFDLGREGRIIFDERTAPEREQLSKAMMSYWSEFAWTGSPGRGRGEDLLPWTAWDEAAPEKPKFIVLDTPSEGGVRMASDVELVDHIVSAVDADTRLPAQVDKCRIFHQMTRLFQALPKQGYARAGKVGCAEYPFAEFPWEGKR